MVEATSWYTTPVERTGRGRIDDIEVLRGIAMVLILVWHALVWATTSETLAVQTPFLVWLTRYVGLWPAVDLFYAISGFVVARSLLPQLAASAEEDGPFRVTLRFWTRRAWRLLPTAWLWLSVILLLATYFNRSGVFGSIDDNVASTIAAVLHFANFRAISHFWHMGGTGVFWTLSQEEQFYFLLPLICLIFRSYTVPLFFALAVLQFFTPRNTITLMTLRSDALMWGVVLARWSQHRSYQSCEPKALGRSAVLRCLALGLPLVGASLLAPIFGAPPVSLRAGMVAVLCASLVFIASFDRDYVMRAGTVKRALIWIGTRSYGLYVIHYPLILAARELAFRVAPRAGGGAVAASGGVENEVALALVLAAFVPIFGLAELNFRLVEAPLRNYGAGVAKRMMRRRSPRDGVPLAVRLPADSRHPEVERH